MIACVFATLWGQWPDGETTATWKRDIEDQAHESAGQALARETPDAVEVRTCVLSGARLVDDVARLGYCITVAVRVRRDALTLDGRVALVKQVRDTLEEAMRPLFSLLLVEKTGMCIEAPALIELRGAAERRG